MYSCDYAQFLTQGKEHFLPQRYDRSFETRYGLKSRLNIAKKCVGLRFRADNKTPLEGYQGGKHKKETIKLKFLFSSYIILSWS